MARIIMKSPYLKPNSGGGKHRGNYAKYIATREGVEIAEDTSKHLHATVKQEDLIRQLLRDFPDSTDFHEYGDYKRSPTRENATELIDRVMETHSGEMASRERYVSYIAERPGVEKLGKHGLFTDEGVPIVLEQVSREMAESQSNIWTHIISLHREDAARLGYDSAEDWMNLLRSKRNMIAKAYAGFLAVEETMADDRLYYRLGSMNITGTGTEVDLEKARYYFEKAAELGNADALYGLGKLYLKQEFPDYDPAKAVEYLEESAAKGNAFAKYQLGKLLCQGELVSKDIARGLPLLKELAENGVTFASYIAGKVYLREEGWQDIKKAILYFRQAAEDGNSYAEYQLGRIYYFGNGVRVDQEKGLEYLKESAARGNEYAANLLLTIQQQHTWGVASCTASLIAQLGRIFQEQDQKRSQRQRPRMDRKHRREIEEKKQAMGIRD